jgi:ATP-dependent RNA helicase SUPV3L1/SUV3
VAQVILDRLPEWTVSSRTQRRLEAYGFDAKTAKITLRDWMGGVEAGLSGVRDDAGAREALQSRGWDVDGLLHALVSEEVATAFEAAMLRHYLEYTVLHESTPPTLVAHLRQLLSITDISRLPFQGQNLPARSLTRHFHLHIGPTNSGKTYNALKALSRAETGAYAGPLRLLAHEVWERLNLGTVGELNGNGRACNLLTGEERRIVGDDAGLLSCTVEMLPLGGAGGDGYDVVVIDEIQMMGDPHRGGSWTTAVLGLKAKEIHLCGDETTMDLLRSLVEPLGDQLTVHRYNRLTPLVVSDKSLNGDYAAVQPGDCIVTFSRTNIFAVKKAVEQTAGRKCAVVYGALPPETRAEQAREFNEGRAEVLVASDAVGMGLNL